MQPSNSSSSEEEVLLAYSVEPTHNRATLERYLTKYPDHANALVDCALELITLPTQVSPIWLSESAVEGGWQEFQSAMGSASESPFAKLSPSAFKKLAGRLHINNLLLLRIRDRAIRAGSIPGEFARQLATELGVSAKNVMGYLEGPPQLSAASSFRSTVKPEALAQIDFSDAVKSSQLTTEQQRKLLAMEA